jgi:DivIVA domain-containing protein
VDLLLLLAALVVLGAVALVAAGRGDRLADAEPDGPAAAALPAGEVRGADVVALRFPLAFRGYRMDQVDAVLDRLSVELAERDARIAELERERPGEA